MMEEKYCHLYNEMILLIICQQETRLSVIFLVVKIGSNYPESSWLLEMCFWWANELKNVCSFSLDIEKSKLFPDSLSKHTDSHWSLVLFAVKVSSH